MICSVSLHYTHDVKCHFEKIVIWAQSFAFVLYLFLFTAIVLTWELEVLLTYTTSFILFLLNVNVVVNYVYLTYLEVVFLSFIHLSLYLTKPCVKTVSEEITLARCHFFNGMLVYLSLAKNT